VIFVQAYKQQKVHFFSSNFGPSQKKLNFFMITNQQEPVLVFGRFFVTIGHSLGVLLFPWRQARDADLENHEEVF
jgi:hypothetical protein